MPSRKFVWDPEHWRFRAEEARTVADQMTHDQARTIRREDLKFHRDPYSPAQDQQAN